MNKKIIIALIAIGLLASAYFYYTIRSEQTLAGGTYKSIAVDLIGTRTGSSTSAVGFYLPTAASSTYPFYVGGKDSGILTFRIEGASTSANVAISVWGSNDFGCALATSTTIYDFLTTTQVQWFDAIQHFATSTPLSNIGFGSNVATTTFFWTDPAVGQYREILLDDLSMECLAVQIHGSSTEVFSQYRLK